MPTPDFDTLIDRSVYPTQKLNASDLKQHFGREDLLPFWIADMDLPAPPTVVDSLVARAEHSIYGYEYRSDSLYTALQAWYARRYDWTIDWAHLEQCPGALAALAILILCNPHNPVGRVWTRAELAQIAAICDKHKVLVVTDEIHGDIVYPPHQYTPYATVSEAAANHSFTCISPAKTFNLAGMVDGFVLIANDDYRRRFNHFADRYQINRNNIFSSVAIETAYRDGEPWLASLLAYLAQNVSFIQTYLQEHLPQVRLVKPEGTYLVWLDFTGLRLDAKALDKFLARKAGLALNSGYWFGSEGAGFARMNIAAPRTLIEQALTQLRQAV